MVSTILLRICHCAIIAAVASAADTQRQRMKKSDVVVFVRRQECRTRFTFTRPTRDNVLSILFGADQDDSGEGAKVSSASFFNHGDVGITQPVESNNQFPSCRGYPPKNTNKHSAFHEQLERGISDGDTTTKCTMTVFDGWRILRFHKRVVGHGDECYRRVQNAVFDWDFEARIGKKSMGIVSASSSPDDKSARRPLEADLNASLNTNNPPGLAMKPRKSLLATFTEICLPGPFKSVFVVNPVRAVYQVEDDAQQIPKCLSSCTAYATLRGHLLAGEERVTTILKNDGSVDIEIVSFSRAAPGFGGRVIWPLIGRMQKQFFLSEMDHIASVTTAEV